MSLPEGLLLFRNFLTEEEEQVMAFDIEFSILDENNNQFMDFGKFPVMFEPLVQRFQKLVSQQPSSASPASDAPSPSNSFICFPTSTCSSPTCSSMTSLVTSENMLVTNTSIGSVTSENMLATNTSIGSPTHAVSAEDLETKQDTPSTKPRKKIKFTAISDSMAPTNNTPPTSPTISPGPVTRLSSLDPNPSSYFSLPSAVHAMSGKPSSLSWMKRLPLFDQVIVNRYEVGDGIKPHVDLAKFDDGVIGISFGSTCVMEFRSLDGQRAVDVLLHPGDLYVMFGPARYEWTHSIPYRKEDAFKGVLYPRGVRLSVTLRKLILDENGLVLSQGRL